MKSDNSPLVVQHLENVAKRVFQEFPSILQEMIGQRAGVYALYRRNHLYYVGLAGNLMSRLRTHLRDHHKGNWDEFSVYLTEHDEHTKELESLLLRVVDVRGNRIRGKFAKSSDLRRDLEKKMKNAGDAQRASLLGGKVAERRRRSVVRSSTGAVKLAGVFDKRTTLKGIRNGNPFKATVAYGGLIRYNGKDYKSPSAAAKAATGKSTNGWVFWTFRSKGRKWVPLRTLQTDR